MAGFARFGAVLGGSAVWVAGAVTLSQQLTKSNCKANEQGDHHNVLIIGGGTSGLAVAGQLMRHSNRPAGSQVSVVDPSHLHAYQPMWTMVGGSLGFKKENSCKPMADVIPKGVNHLSEGVKDFVPDKNQVVLQNGKTITYDYLVMATGIKPDWEKIEGLKEALDDPKCPVASIYDFHHSEKVDRIMSEFKGGVAIFTQPACPIKCGGAPQKVMWLQEEMFRKRGIRGDVDLNFCTNLGAMFAVKKYADSLAKLVVDKNVNVHHKNNLVKVDKDAKIATFQHLDTQELIQRPFDVLHVAPYMSPPEVVQKSSLANENGFVDVDKHTLQHTKHPNVFGIGDSSNLPTSKTAAAISSQAPVLVSNLLHKMKDEPLTAKYDGYTSCPIFVGDKKLILAEFGYDGVVMETFPWDQSVPSRLAFHLKKDFFPFVYWNSFVKGTWFGRTTWWAPATSH